MALKRSGRVGVLEDGIEDNMALVFITTTSDNPDPGRYIISLSRTRSVASVFLVV
jgi:hypothetical protein